MSEPWFWRAQTAPARLLRAALAPAAALYDAGQRLRWRLTAPVDAGVPVICVGNASVGGTGKTPFCLLLQRLLAAEGIEAHFLTRGYGGSLKGPVRVNPQQRADDVGDEALLLAAAAPTWVAKDRMAGARAAAATGAKLLIMDDGFQNPAVKKTVSLLLVSGDEEGLAQFPAGPMREPIGRAMRRADALILDSRHPGAARRGDSGVHLAPAGDGAFSAERFTVFSTLSPSIPPQRVVAFCGIGRPGRFFHDLEGAGFTLAARRAFADHHPFSAADLQSLRAAARAENAALITTEKDLVRLAPADRNGVAVARLTLNAGKPAALVRFVRERIKR